MRSRARAAALAALVAILGAAGLAAFFSSGRSVAAGRAPASPRAAIDSRSAAVHIEPAKPLPREGAPGQSRPVELPNARPEEPARADDPGPAPVATIPVRVLTAEGAPAGEGFAQVSIRFFECPAEPGKLAIDDVALDAEGRGTVRLFEVWPGLAEIELIQMRPAVEGALVGAAAPSVTLRAREGENAPVEMRLVPAAGLEVLVRDAAGAPAPGVWVQIPGDGRPGSGGSAQTGADGIARISPIRPGRLRAVARCPHTFAEGVADLAVVPGRQRAEITLGPPPPACGVDVRFVEPEGGDFLFTGQLTLSCEGGLREGIYVETETPTAHVLVPRVPEGDWSISAWTETALEYDAVRVSVRATEGGVVPATVVARRVGVLEVRLVSEGRPLEGTITVGRDGPGFYYSAEGDSPRAEIAAIGKVLLIAEAEGFARTDVTVEVAPGERKPVDIEMRRGGTLVVEGKYDTGVLAEGQMFHYWPAGRPELAVACGFEADGRFRARVSPGAYEASCRGAVERAVVQDGGESVIVFRLKGGPDPAEVAAVPANVERASGRVLARVSEPDGTPAAAGVIIFAGDHGQRSGGFGSGVGAIDLPAGAYRASAQDATGRTGESVAIEVAPGVTTQVALVLPRGAPSTVAGRVTGIPPGRGTACLRADPLEEHQLRSVSSQTDAAGRFEIAPLAPGARYHVIVTDTRYEGLPVEVTAPPPGERREVELAVVARPAGRIELAGGVTYFLVDHEVGSQSASSDGPGGAPVMVEVPPGRATIRAAFEWPSPVVWRFERTIEVADGATVRVDAAPARGTARLAFLIACAADDARVGVSGPGVSASDLSMNAPIAIDGLPAGRYSITTPFADEAGVTIRELDLREGERVDLGVISWEPPVPEEPPPESPGEEE